MSDKIVRAQLALLAKHQAIGSSQPAAGETSKTGKRDPKRKRRHTDVQAADAAEAIRKRNMDYYTATAPKQ